MEFSFALFDHPTSLKKSFIFEFGVFNFVDICFCKMLEIVTRNYAYSEIYAVVSTSTSIYITDQL